MTGFKQAALDAISTIEWIPQVGQKRTTAADLECDPNSILIKPYSLCRFASVIGFKQAALTPWIFRSAKSPSGFKPSHPRKTELFSCRFASVTGFKQAALDAISTVEWIPQVGQNRITGMTAGRSDWCISRQRNWGVPIPVFYDKETGEPLMTEETIAHVQGGGDVTACGGRWCNWWRDSTGRWNFSFYAAIFGFQIARRSGTGGKRGLRVAFKLKLAEHWRYYVQTCILSFRKQTHEGSGTKGPS